MDCKVILVIGILLMSCHYTNGAEYFLGFIPHFDKHPSVIMTTTESTPVYYRIEAPGMDYCLNGTILPNRLNTVDLPGNLTGRSNVYPNRVRDKIPKGIYLKTSSDQVTVIGQNGGENTIDTFLGVPIRNLCLREYVYYPFSVAAYVRADASIAIVGTEDNTTVTITASVRSKISFNSTSGWSRLRQNQNHSYVINKLQTVYVAAYLTDLTGSKIVADKPLSVISGHECAFVPSFVSACDHLIEQMLPTALWGKTYYVAPLASRNSYTLKIIAANNNTKVNLICNGTQTNFQINDGEHRREVYRAQEYCAIHSNKIISVVQLSHGFQEDHVGDPMMTLIPAVNDYSNQIVSSTNDDITHTDYKQYVNLVVMPDYYQPNLIYLNVGNINHTLESYSWTPIVVNNITEAYVAKVYLNFTEKMFKITHLNKSALMSGILYGFLINPIRGSNSREGYGHPAGFNIIKKYSRYHITCPGSDNINNRIPSVSDFMCDCTSQIDCTPVVDNCSPNPCQNNGTCLNDGIDFTCICPPGFIDDNCGISIDDCYNDNNPCQNNGTCVDLPVGYMCVCPEGYTGNNCSAALPCNSNPCLNNAACIDLTDDYTCICLDGYTGKDCNTVLNCNSNPCLNNAACVDLTDDYTCICPDGYTGKDCNIVLYCSSNPCQNNGTCTETALGYTCNCIKGFTGDTCSDQVNDCRVNSCKNNGLCVYRDESFWCNCPPGYGGVDCSVSVNVCDPNPCQNNGNCTVQNSTVGFTCFCALEYTGSFCEIKRTYTCNAGVNTAASSSSSSSSSNKDDSFIPGFFVGLAAGAIIVIIVIIILAVVYKKYSYKNCNNTTSSFAMQKFKNRIDNQGLDNLSYEATSDKDNQHM